VLTADKLLELTGDPTLHAEATRAAGALALFDIDARPTDCYFILDCSTSTAGERGVDPKTGERLSALPDLMRPVVMRAQVLAALLDPNDECGAVAVQTEAMALPTITPQNYMTWYDQNMPKPSGRTNLGAAMRLALTMLGEEQDVPELANLGRVRRDTPDKNLPRIALKNPATIIVVVEGDPSDGALVERILHATKFLAIRWVFAFVSNERLGIQMLKSMKHVNPSLHLCIFPRGMQEVGEPLFYAEILNGQKHWYDQWNEAA